MLITHAMVQGMYPDVLPDGSIPVVWVPTGITRSTIVALPWYVRSLDPLLFEMENLQSVTALFDRLWPVSSFPDGFNPTPTELTLGWYRYFHPNKFVWLLPDRDQRVELRRLHLSERAISASGFAAISAALTAFNGTPRTRADTWL